MIWKWVNSKTLTFRYEYSIIDTTIYLPSIGLSCLVFLEKDNGPRTFFLLKKLDNRHTHMLPFFNHSNLDPFPLIASLLPLNKLNYVFDIRIKAIFSKSNISFVENRPLEILTYIISLAAIFGDCLSKTLWVYPHFQVKMCWQILWIT